MLHVKVVTDRTYCGRVLLEAPRAYAAVPGAWGAQRAHLAA